jgi:flagellar protein FliS
MKKENKMNATQAIDAYTKIRKETLSEEQLGHNVISVALNRLQKNLHILFTSEDTKVRTKAFERAILTIYYLQKSLDLVTGGELAKHLFRLYEFCRLKVLECGVHNSNGSQEIKTCRDFIAEIAESWGTIQKA